MNPADTPQSSPLAGQARRPRKDSENSSTIESSQKQPKKVNSELRKQQNRIASRNYREKRKRKLQYLQQILRDDSTEPQSGQSAETASNPRSRSISLDYDAQREIMDISAIPPTPGFGGFPFTAESTIVSDPSTPASFPFMSPPNLAPAWNPPMYGHPSPNGIPTWSDTQWMSNSNFNHAPRMPASPLPQYGYSAPPPQTFQQVPATFPSFEESYPAANVGPEPSNPPGYRRPTGHHPQWMSSVSPQFSSTHSQWQYSGPP